MADHPWNEVVAGAETAIKNGALIFQKFSCASCGNRLTMEAPNAFWTHGTCDHCGHLTDIRAQGCNYMLILSSEAAKKRLLEAHGGSAEALTIYNSEPRQ